MIFSIMEIIDAIIISLAVGYIMMDYFKRYISPSPLTYYGTRFFDANAFKLAVMVVAPSIILHELGHKFAAMGFGYAAVFHAAYFWLVLGVLLKTMGSSFIFFVPAFTSISVGMNNLQAMITSASGPLTNLLIFLGATIVMRSTSKYSSVLHLLKKVNLFLFAFNMIPIPGFDGFYIFGSLIALIFH